MRLLILAFVLFFYGYKNAAAEINVTYCDGCNLTQKQGAAIMATAAGGVGYVGDRKSGSLAKFYVDSEPGANGDIYFAVRHTTEVNYTEEFFAYAAAWREVGPSLKANIAIDGANLQDVPVSAWQVMNNGAERAALIAWASNLSNWEARLPALAFYAKLVARTGQSWFTGNDFVITFTVSFSDGTSVVLQYNSATQQVEFVKALDSAGVMLATNSPTEIQVDLSHWVRPGATSRPDFSSALSLLVNIGASGGGSGGRIGCTEVAGRTVCKFYPF